MADEPTPEEARRYGLRLKSLRVQQDRDVKDVAGEVGVSNKAWYAYEDGRSVFPYTRLPRIAKALRVSIGVLLQRIFGEELQTDSDSLSKRPSFESWTRAVMQVVDSRPYAGFVA